MCDRPKSSVGSSEDYPLANTTLRLYTCGRMFAPSFASFPLFQRKRRGKKDKQERETEKGRERAHATAPACLRVPFSGDPRFSEAPPRPWRPFQDFSRQIAHWPNPCSNPRWERRSAAGSAAARPSAAPAVLRPSAIVCSPRSPRSRGGPQRRSWTLHCPSCCRHRCHSRGFDT